VGRNPVKGRQLSGVRREELFLRFINSRRDIGKKRGLTERKGIFCADSSSGEQKACKEDGPSVFTMIPDLRLQKEVLH